MTGRQTRITIVAHALRAGGGISVGKNLILSLTGKKPDAHYQIFIPPNLGYENIPAAGTRCEFIPYTPTFGLVGRWFYDKTRLIQQIAEFSPDIVLCLGNVAVEKDIAPQILLVQDSHLFYPQRHYSRESPRSRMIYRYKQHRFAQSLKRCCVLLCQTETAKRRIQQHYHYRGDMVILPNSLSVDSISGARSDAPKPDGDSFRMIYLTRYYPHKNLEIFLDLFAKYREQLDNVVLFTTIAPEQHKGARAFLEAVSARKLEKHIVNLGPVDQRDIAAMFGSMDALVMPSTLESFSGAYLEAMAFDCPILTSDLDFAHEVCGDAALYFDPWSVDSLFSTLRYAIDNPQERKRLAATGRDNLSKNSQSWDQNVDALIAVIERQLARSEADTANRILTSSR